MRSRMKAAREKAKRDMEDFRRKAKAKQEQRKRDKQAKKEGTDAASSKG